MTGGRSTGETHRGQTIALFDWDCAGCDKRFEIYIPPQPEDKEFDLIPKCPECGRDLEKVITFNGTIIIN